MFASFSYKNKSVLLIIGIIILLYIAYIRSYKFTIESAYKKEVFKEKTLNIKVSNAQLNQLELESDLLDKTLASSSMSSDIIQQKILSFISNSNQVEVIKLEKTQKFKNNKYIVYTNQLTLEGTYNNLISSIYNFEKRFNLAKIVSVKFYKKKILKQRKEKLFLYIIFQNYEKAN